MNPDDAISATTVLTALGLGKYAAGIVSLIGCGLWLSAQVMPVLPVPTAASSPWYAIPYGILARLVGSWRNAAPMPASGSPAGGVVPVPPPLKKG